MFPSLSRPLAALRAGALILAVATPAPAQDAPPAPPILPANDDVTDGTDTTDTGLLQVELGGVFTRTDASTRTGGTPLLLRYGAFDWLEVSAGTDGYLTQRARAGATSGLGNTLIGARVRLFAARGGLPILSVLPTVVLPTASRTKGLGSGDTDAAIAVISGRDLPGRSHVDLSYGAASIGDGEGGRLAQHNAFVSGTLGVTPAWSPGITLTWLSRQDAATGRALLLSADSVVTLSRRLAVDVSVVAGLNRAAPDVEISAGLSVVVGELDLDDGVHARRHRLRLRRKRGPKRPNTPTPELPARPVDAPRVSVTSHETTVRVVR